MCRRISTGGTLKAEMEMMILILINILHAAPGHGGETWGKNETLLLQYTVLEYFKVRSIFIMAMVLAFISIITHGTQNTYEHVWLLLKAWLLLGRENQLSASRKIANT